MNNILQIGFLIIALAAICYLFFSLKSEAKEIFTKKNNSRNILNSLSGFVGVIFLFTFLMLTLFNPNVNFKVTSNNTDSLNIIINNFKDQIVIKNQEIDKLNSELRNCDSLLKVKNPNSEGMNYKKIFNDKFKNKSSAQTWFSSKD